MSGLALERAWPYVAALILTFLWWQYFDATFPVNGNALVGATGTVSAVLVGFLVTAKAIVLGLTGSPTFKALVSSGYHKIFFSYLFEAEIGGISLLVISIVGFFVGDENGVMPTEYKVIWILGAFASLGLFARVMFLLFSFLRKV